MEKQQFRTANVVRKKTKTGGLTPPYFKTHWKSCCNQDCGTGERTYPHGYSQLIVDKGAKAHKNSKEILLTNVAGRILNIHIPKCTMRLVFAQKLTQSGLETNKR